MEKGDVIDYGCPSQHVVRAKVMVDGNVPTAILCPACNRKSMLLGGKANAWRKLISARAMPVDPEWKAGFQFERLVIAPVKYLEAEDWSRLIAMNLPGEHQEA